MARWAVLTHCDYCDDVHDAGFMGPLDPELGALFHHVIGTLVRLIEPRR